RERLAGRRGQGDEESAAGEIPQRLRGLPRIVLGDFNEDSKPGTDSRRKGVYDLLLDQGEERPLVDSSRKAGPGPRRGTFHNWEDEADERYPEVIDWILTDREITTTSWKVHTHKPKGGYPSDHFPVEARLQLP
ncbi:MAG: hypothetical protein LBV60_10490, partial [Streptomyces sp.]|nr:hypothetical protein [Streptomyces sp.]